MFRKSPLFIAFCLNILYLLLYVLFGQIRHGSLDDYFMSSVLTGAYGGEYDVHMYFVNAAYGYFLKPFYWLFPKAGWYFIFEILGTFASFTVLSYFLIRQQGIKWGVALSLLLLSSLTPDFYFQVSFTQCAATYTAAGLLLFFFGSLERKMMFLFGGGIFLAAGNVMRHEGFLLGMPYLILLLVELWLARKQLTKKMLAALCLILFAIYCLQVHDRALYDDGEYRYYADYQPIRAYFGDGAFYDKESTFDELEERGMSGPDFNILKGWMFYDTEVLHKDSLESIKSVAQNNLYKPNLKRLPVAFFLAVSNAFTRTAGWCWAILCALLFFSKSKTANIYPWVSLGIIAVSIGYLLLVNRLVYHVESGIWLYSIALLIPFLDISEINKGVLWSKIEKTFFYGIIFAAVVFAMIGISNQSHLKDQFSVIDSVETPKSWTEFLAYAKNNPENVFLLSFERYKEFGMIRNPPYIAIGPGDFDNIFSLGYWNIHLPAMKQELAKRGVKNPVCDIVHDNVFLLEESNRPSLQSFYREHYHKSVLVDTVKAFGDLLLLKYCLPSHLEENLHE